MVRVAPGPEDVPRASLRVTRRVQQVPADQTGRMLAEVGSAAEQALYAIREQQGENEIYAADLRLRNRLDAARRELEQDNDFETYEQRWTERADAIVAEERATVQGPRYGQVFDARAGEHLLSGTVAVRDLARRRGLDRTQAGIIENVGQIERMVTDPNTAPARRGELVLEADAMVRRAISNGMLSEVAGASALDALRTSLTRFERDEGFRVEAQGHVARITAAHPGDLAAQLTAAHDELQGAMEDDVVTRLNANDADGRRAVDSALTEAMGRAYQVIERTGGLDGLTAEDRETITYRGQMNALRTYINNKNGGAAGDGWTAMTRRSNLIRYTGLGFAAEDQTARRYAQINLYEPLGEDEAGLFGVPPGTRLTEVMMPDDFNVLRERQREMRGETPVGDGATTVVDQAYRSMWNYVQPRLSSQIATLTAEQRREHENMLRAFLREEAASFVRNNPGRLPREADLVDTARLAMGEVRFDREGRRIVGVEFGGAHRNVPAYQAPRDQDPATAVRVPYSLIPAADRQRLQDALAATSPNLRRLYEASQNDPGQRGIFSNMLAQAIEDAYNAERNGVE